MHDLMFAKEIIGALNNELNSVTKGSKITAVNVSLSPLSHVKPETLAETFKATVKGTGFEKITLSIKVLPLGIKCRACKHSFMVDKPTTRCIKCNDSDLDIVYNKEFLVDSIQVQKV